MGVLKLMKEQRLELKSTAIVIRTQSLSKVMLTSDDLARALASDVLTNGEIDLITGYLDQKNVLQDVIGYLASHALQADMNFVLFDEGKLQLQRNQRGMDLLGRSVPDLLPVHWLSSMVRLNDCVVWLKDMQIEYDHKAYWELVVERMLLHKQHPYAGRRVEVYDLVEDKLNYHPEGHKHGRLGKSKKYLLDYVNYHGLI